MDHSCTWSEWTVVSAPTYEAEGKEERVCQNCSSVENRRIDKLVKEPIKNPFEDVAEGAYYYDPVLWAYSNNITTGTCPTLFSPEKECTRGQIVTFLWRALEEPLPTSSENPFTDVELKMYYGNAVLWAVENGVTTGTGKDEFSPEEACTRGQVVTFLYRAVAR